MHIPTEGIPRIIVLHSQVNLRLSNFSNHPSLLKTAEIINNFSFNFCFSCDETLLEPYILLQLQPCDQHDEESYIRLLTMSKKNVYIPDAF